MLELLCLSVKLLRGFKVCTVGLTWSKTDDWFFLMKSILGTEFACSGEGNCSSDHDQKFSCKLGAGRRDMISGAYLVS